MEIELTDKEIETVSFLKRHLGTYIQDNINDMQFNDLSQFSQSLLTQLDNKRVGFKLLSWDVNTQILAGTISFLGEPDENDDVLEKTVEFTIHGYQDKSKLEKQMEELIENCEPWRKGNTKLSEQEDALRDKCNSDEPYKASFMFSDDGIAKAFVAGVLIVLLVVAIAVG